MDYDRKAKDWTTTEKQYYTRETPNPIDGKAYIRLHESRDHGDEESPLDQYLNTRDFNSTFFKKDT